MKKMKKMKTERKLKRKGKYIDNFDFLCVVEKIAIQAPASLPWRKHAKEKQTAHESVARVQNVRIAGMQRDNRTPHPKPEKKKNKQKIIIKSSFRNKKRRGKERKGIPSNVGAIADEQEKAKESVERHQKGGPLPAVVDPMQRKHVVVEVDRQPRRNEALGREKLRDVQRARPDVEEHQQPKADAHQSERAQVSAKHAPKETPHVFFLFAGRVNLSARFWETGFPPLFRFAFFEDFICLCAR